MKTPKLSQSLVAVAVMAAVLPGCDLLNDDTHHSVACEWPQVANEAQDQCIEGRKLHVASPDWRDQIIYFVMPDRFNDGNSENNDQGKGEYDTSSEAHYSGGDIPGVLEKVDYIKQLGATALWMTPVVANQWWDPVNKYGGYHGYWARDFKSVDEHYGTLDDLKNLSHALHNNGMYLVQDVVANHVGNFFQYEGGYDANNTAEHFSFSGAVPTTKPTQAPFDLNDRNNPEHVKADIYHWTPKISDYNDANQEKRYQLSGLDDLNTSNPKVRDALRDSFGYWIKEVGVDAFRFDTVKYVEFDFWNDFLHSQDAANPGIYKVAQATGRKQFLTFGEVWETSKPLESKGEEKLASYLGDQAKPGMDALINFPLYMSIGRVFAEGQPTHYMGFRLQQHMKALGNPYLTPVFIDNHDTQRFLASGSQDSLKQALTMIMTIPGIPVIYQGMEQGLTESREAMFVGGYHNDEADRFDQNSDMYQYVQKLAKLRTENRIFTRGTLEVLADNPTGPGVLAYKREYEGKTALVLINTADSEVLLNQIDTGLDEGAELSLMHKINYSADDALVAGADGKLTMGLPANAALIVLAEGGVSGAPNKQITIEVDQALEGKTFAENLTLTGTTSTPNVEMKLVVDGKLKGAATVTSDNKGDWRTVVHIANFMPGLASHTVALYDAKTASSTATYHFKTNVTLDGTELTIEDAADDDYGYNANYTTPQDASFNKQMDIEKVDVVAAGSTLSLTLTMQELTDSWAPDNGFDHVAFSIFFDLPGKDGVEALPEMYGKAPNGFAWDVASVSFGWGNLMYSSEGATASKRGASLSTAPEIKVNKAARTITFTYDGNALGLTDWEQARIYITNWDIDGMSGSYRALTPDGAAWEFGGGAESDPRIMDDVEVITIPVSGVTVTDEANDEAYSAPQDASFSHQMDILSANVKTAGSNLQIKLKMAELTDSWAPDNGFDHVAFTVFVDRPDLNGATVLPRMNVTAPNGFDWEAMSVSFGWGNAAYSHENATADKWGTPLSAAPQISVNKDDATVSLLLSAEMLGNPDSLENVKIYVTTWDIDGMSGSYRDLSPDGAAWEFGGGKANDPKIMDSVLISLP